MGTQTFPTGTRTIFQQSSAPSGWTKDATYTDYALRIVSGTASTGGSTNFTTVHTASGSWAGTVSGTTPGLVSAATAGTGSHTHPGSYWGFSAPSFSAGTTPGGATTLLLPSVTPISSPSIGSGGTHDHPISVGGTFTGSARSFAISYVDVIIASMN